MSMIYSLSRLIRQVRRRKELGITLLLALIAVSIGGNTISFYLFEGAANPDITLWDGLWYSVISVTTIGYGDFSAETLGARIGTAVFIVLIGLATFTTALGMAVDWVADLRHKERKGMGRANTKDHLVMVNFPGEARVRQIIREYRRDPEHKSIDIVLVADNIEEMPFDSSDVSFVRGWPLDEDTYRRANLEHARQVMILSPSHEDPRSDSLVASIAFVVHRVNPDVRVIAECLDSRHSVLFNASANLSLVHGLEIVNNLFVQESQDSGVMRLILAITSNEIEGTLASTVVSSPPPQGTYTAAAKTLLDHGINLVGVIKDDAVRMDFDQVQVSQGDLLVYISRSRVSSEDMDALLRQGDG